MSNNNDKTIFEMYNLFWYYPETHEAHDQVSYFNNSTNSINTYKIPALILFPAFLTPAVIEDGKPLHLLLAVKEEERELTVADVNAQLKFTLGLDSYKTVNREPLFETLKNNEIKIKKVGDLKKGIIEIPDFKGMVYSDIVKLYKDSGYETIYHVAIKMVCCGSEPKEGALMIDLIASKVAGNIKDNPGERLAKYKDEKAEANRKGKKANPLRPVEKSDKFIRRILKEMNGDKLKESGRYTASLPQGTGKPYEEEWDSPIQSYHPLFIQVKPRKYYNIAHMADIHVSSRQELMALSPARVIESDKVGDDISPEIGKMVNISSRNVNDFLEKVGKDGELDMILIGGDVIDHVPNIPINEKLLKDIKKNGKISVKKMWDKFRIDTETFSVRALSRIAVGFASGSPMLSDYVENERHQDFIDMIYLYSLVIDFYCEYKKPIYLVSGNHDAYRAPYGISPRVEILFGLIKKRANENVPADHNLTFHEAILAFGESYCNVMDSSKLMEPKHFSWFYSVLTPFSDYSVELSSQIILGLHWGDDEDLTEFFNMEIVNRAHIGQGDGHLPRTNEAVSDLQLKFINKTIEVAAEKKIILNTHFTFLCYKEQIPYLAKETASLRLDDTPYEPETSEYSPYEMGTFETNRDKVYRDIVNKIDYIFTGHSHRRGLYKILKFESDSSFNPFDDSRAKGIYLDLSTSGYSGTGNSASTYIDDGENHFSSWSFKKIEGSYNSPAIIVSDSLGPLPRHNKDGEFNGWGSDCPSGTKVTFNQTNGDIKTIDLFRINNNRTKPRFVVALDYWDILESTESELKFRWGQLDLSSFNGEKENLGELADEIDCSNLRKFAKSFDDIVSDSPLSEYAEENNRIKRTLQLKHIKLLSDKIKMKQDESYRRHLQRNSQMHSREQFMRNMADSMNDPIVSEDEIRTLNIHILRELLPKTAFRSYPVLGKIKSDILEGKIDALFFIPFSPFLNENGIKVEELSLNYFYSNSWGHIKSRIDQYNDIEDGTTSRQKTLFNELSNYCPALMLNHYFKVIGTDLSRLKSLVNEEEVKYFISIKFGYSKNDKHKLFMQYDFGSRWNFPVEVKIEDSRIIIERDKEKAEIPDFDWYKKNFEKYQ